jgi:hypothetical protein
LWAGLLAIVLTLSSLWGGFVADDYGILLTLRGNSRVYEHLQLTPLDLFRFFDGDPERGHQLMEQGLLSWWSDPHMKAGFWRPLTSLTHSLDFRLWGETAWPMHAASVLLYGIVAALAAVLYRRWSGVTGVAVLAALLYAVDDSHGVPVGWIANRNAVLAVCFGLVALWGHDRWRRDGWKPGPFLSVGAFLLSLLSGEAGIAVCAYLFAYALFLDRAKPANALLTLAPYLGTIVIWRVAWALQGYGTGAIGLYTDPLREPLAFAHVFAQRFPLLFLSQWALPPAEIFLLIGPQARHVHTAVAIGFMVLVILLFYPVLRRHRVAGFYLVGMLLALVPVCAAFPHDRMLFFVSIGAMGLIGTILSEAFGRPSRLWPGRPVRMAVVCVAVLLVVIHLVVGPVLLGLRARFPLGDTRQMASLLMLDPLRPGDEDRDIIIVNPVDSFLVSGTLAVREARGLNLPRSLRLLAPGTDGMRITRINERTLEIEPRSGYFGGLVAPMFMARDYRMQVGQRVKLRGMTATVVTVDERGQPRVARFTFEGPLEDPRLRWLVWAGRYDDLPLPAVGQTLELEGL